VQASTENVKNILKLKKNFPHLLLKKIEDIYKTINNIGKSKPYINMTTKKPLHKQIIILMSNKNITKFMASSGEHVANINHTLKNIKSDIFINFIYFNYYVLIVTFNKVTSPSDLGVVENYIRNINSINSNDVQTTHLPQFKSYSKILNIPYCD